MISFLFINLPTFLVTSRSSAFGGYGEPKNYVEFEIEEDFLCL